MAPADAGTEAAGGVGPGGKGGEGGLGGNAGSAGAPTGGSGGAAGQGGVAGVGGMGGHAGEAGAAGAAASSGAAGMAGAAGAAGSAGAAGTAGTAGASGTGGTGGSTNGFAAFRYRRKLTITAQTAVPHEYSVLFTLDHATLCTDGKSLPSGRDVHVARWTGTTWIARDRVLGLESGWNEQATSVWFRPALPVPVGQDESNYVYYGDPAASVPAEDPTRVFMFVEDFESGTLDRWTPDGAGYWSVATDQARSGQHALKAGPSTGVGRKVVATEMDLADMAVDAYWRMSQVAEMDLAQALRVVTSTDSHYETNLEGTPGWDIAKIINGGWTEIVNQPSGQNPQANVWTRVTTTIAGSTMAVFRNGSQIVPSTGTTEMGGEIPGGAVGFRVWRIPNGQAWWIDDVRVRKHVRPEPEVTVGPEEEAPFTSL